MINALTACEPLIIPVQTEFLIINDLERMLNTLTLSRENSIEYTILLTIFDKRTRASRGSLKHLQTKYAQHVWNGYISIDTNFREASRYGRPLSIVAPKARSVNA